MNTDKILSMIIAGLVAVCGASLAVAAAVAGDNAPVAVVVVLAVLSVATFAAAGMIVRTELRS